MLALLLQALLWQPAPAIPAHTAGYGQGVSAQYGAATDSALIVAGGANFPETPAADGGAKRYYPDIYTLRHGAWQYAGRLPQASAYGMSVAWQGEMVCIGGRTAEGCTDKVYAIDARGRLTRTLPSLPLPLAEGAAARWGTCIYVCGGTDGVEPQRSVWRMDMSDADSGWQALAPLPAALLQPVMAATADSLYVWGGYNPKEKTASAAGYRCAMRGDMRWEAAAPHPQGGTFTGAAVTTVRGEILAAGGVDRDVFTRALHMDAAQTHAYQRWPRQDYRWQHTLWRYDTAAGAWRSAGQSDVLSRAGASLLYLAPYLYIIGGELKPGIRTPDNYMYLIGEL